MAVGSFSPGAPVYDPDDSPYTLPRRATKAVYRDDWGEHDVTYRDGVASYQDRVGVHRWATGPMEGERVTQSQRDYERARRVSLEHAQYRAMKGAPVSNTLTVHPAPAKVKIPPWWQHWTTVRWARALNRWLWDRFKIPEIEVAPERTDQPYLDALAQLEEDLLRGGPCTTITESQSSAPMTPTRSPNLTTLQHARLEFPSWPMDTLAMLCQSEESRLILIKSRSRGWGSTSVAETPPSKPTTPPPTCACTDMQSRMRSQAQLASGLGNPIDALFSQMAGASSSTPGGMKFLGTASSEGLMSSVLGRSLGL